MPGSPPPLRARNVIVEYKDEKDQPIYGFGTLASDGTLVVDEDMGTVGSLPGAARDVVKADGSVVSYGAYCAELTS